MGKDEEFYERVFCAVTKQMASDGLKFSMDNLASALGISKRTLYEKISSKEDVLELVINKVFIEVKNMQNEILEDNTLSIRKKIERLLTVTPIYADYLDFRRVNELKKQYPSLYEKVCLKIEGDWDKTLDLISQGIKSGDVKDTNLLIVKEIFCAAYEKLLNGQFLIDNNITYKEGMNQIIHIILDGIMR